MNRISDLRAEHDIRQKALADQLGWASSRLSNYESGLRKPALDDCRAIVAAFRALGVDCNLDTVFPPKGKEQAA